MMEMVLGGVVFVAFLLAQVAAVAAIRSEKRSQAHAAVLRDRDARELWYAAP